MTLRPAALQRFRDHTAYLAEQEPGLRLDLIRNTKQIAQLFSSLSGEVLKPRGMAGAPVRLVECSADGVVDCADDAVDALLDEGWEPGQVALLTTQHRHPEQKNAVDVGGWAAYWDAFFAEEDVFYGHVLGFKGLERSVVVLAVNGFRDLERVRRVVPCPFAAGRRRRTCSPRAGRGRRREAAAQGRGALDARRWVMTSEGTATSVRDGAQSNSRPHVCPH